jgi:hypothetical protein
MGCSKEQSRPVSQFQPTALSAVPARHASTSPARLPRSFQPSLSPMRGRVRALCAPALPQLRIFLELLLFFVSASRGASGARAPATLHALVLSTTDGGVLGLDAATGARIFELPPQPNFPAVSSWAAPGQPQYIPSLSGALFRIHPNTDVAEQVSNPPRTPQPERIQLHPQRPFLKALPETANVVPWVVTTSQMLRAVTPLS